MMISKINMGATKVGFGAAQPQQTKNEPNFIYDADKLPKGYHWEQDLDNDRYVAVKNGYKFNEDKHVAEPNAPYTPVIKAKNSDKQEIYRLAANIHKPAAGYHIELDLDSDRYYEVKNGHKLPF